MLLCVMPHDRLLFQLIFRYVCESVSRRASMMASAGITALLKKMDYKDVVIAIDGSLFRYISRNCQ